METFVLKKEDLEAVLAAIQRRMRRLRPHLREVYRLKCLSEKTHPCIAQELHFGERTIDRYVGQLKASVAGTLHTLGPDRLAPFWRHFGAE